MIPIDKHRTTPTTAAFKCRAAEIWNPCIPTARARLLQCLTLQYYHTNLRTLLISPIYIIHQTISLPMPRVESTRFAIAIRA